MGYQRDINPFALVAEFIEYRKRQGITKYTATSFRSCLNNFLAEYRGNIKDGPKLKQQVAIFLSDKKASYFNKLLQALRQYFDYCIGEGILKENPTAGIRWKRTPIRIVEHDEKVIRAFLSVMDKSTFAGYRDFVIVLVMMDCGLRPNELVQIRISDIDFVSRQITIREEYSKTREQRIVPISDVVAQEIKKLINARHEAWDIDAPVFCSFSGNSMSSHNLQEKFRQYSEKLGTPITPYQLRHVFATTFIRNGGNVFALQRILGHSKLDTTKVYVNLAAADVRNQHAQASPINSLLGTQNRVGNIKR